MPRKTFKRKYKKRKNKRTRKIKRRKRRRNKKSQKGGGLTSNFFRFLADSYEKENLNEQRKNRNET